MKGLIIRQPWVGKILRGAKAWEIRGFQTKIRRPIALIQSGTGTVVGVCDVVDVHGPLSLEELRRTKVLGRWPLVPAALRVCEGWR